MHGLHKQYLVCLAEPALFLLRRKSRKWGPECSCCNLILMMFYYCYPLSVHYGGKTLYLRLDWSRSQSSSSSSSSWNSLRSDGGETSHSRLTSSTPCQTPWLEFGWAVNLTSYFKATRFRMVFDWIQPRTIISRTNYSETMHETEVTTRVLIDSTKVMTSPCGHLIIRYYGSYHKNCMKASCFGKHQPANDKGRCGLRSILSFDLPEENWVNFSCFVRVISFTRCLT